MQGEEPRGADAGSATSDALAGFDALRRGDAAPDWVTAGIAAAWGLDPGTLAATLIVLSENVTFRVALDGLPRMVVRLGRPGYATDLAHSRSELVWIEALRADRGIPTPAPIHGLDGHHLQTLRDGAGAAWTATAFGWVEGTVLEEQPGFERHFAELGRLTAELHLHARGWTPPDDFSRFAWRLDDLVGPAARWGDWRAAVLNEAERRLLERAETAARAVIAETAPHPVPDAFGLIHADLRPSNVMTTPAGDLAIIDFDDAGRGWYRYDFAAALSFYEHRDAAREMVAGWLDGYRETIPLDRAQLDEAAAWSMIRRLTMLGWQQTHREDALPPDLWAENRPGTLEVAARYLADARWLIP